MIRRGLATQGGAQGVASAARGVAFIVGGAVAGAHRAAGGFSADTGAVAHFDRAAKTVLVGVIKIRVDRIEIGAGEDRVHAEVFGDRFDRPGGDDVTGVEDV